MSDSINEKPTFPVYLQGHTLKYEIECVLKLFLPMTKFTFFYDKNDMPSDEDGASLSLVTQDGQSHFEVCLRLDGETTEAETYTSPLDPVRQKAACEYTFCDLLFGLLEKHTDLHPAWGILTGIRPVKNVQRQMRQGRTHTEILQDMETRLHVRADKAQLAYAIAAHQEPILAQTPPCSVSLYISIPFCPTRCSYCSFVSQSVEQAGHLMSAYVDCLCRELALWGEIVRAQNLTLDTIYLGGGTPTTLSATQLTQLFSVVQDNFDLSHIREYCVEAGRPDTITTEKLDVCRAYGITRLSVNPQTMEDDVLRTIGRRHTAAQTRQAYTLARQVGFQNINMDLIAGLPGDTVSGFRETLSQIIEMAPDSITVHALTLKRASNLYSVGETQVCNPVDAMVTESETCLLKAGYLPYYLYRQKNTIDNLENVGYALPGKDGLYNILIMDESQMILGAGCGASTKLFEASGKITRIYNYKFPYEYVAQFDQLMQKKEQVRQILSEKQEAEA